MVTRWVQWWEASPAALMLLAAALLYLLALSVVLGRIDIRTHKLPNRFVLPAYPVAGVLLGGAAIAAGEPARILGSWGGALALFLLYLLLWVIYPAGMGLGDVKLAGVLGLYLGLLGWEHVMLGVGAGFVLGGLWGVVLLISRRGTLKSTIPFGPAMLAGTWLVLLAVPG